MIWELVRALDGRAPQIRLRHPDGDEAIEIRRMSYVDAVFGSSPPGGVVIFGDIEYLRPVEQPHVARLWHRLAKSSGVTRLLNHPLRAMRRYELLRALRERAINDFDAYSLLEARRPSRYPVYLTREAGPNELPLELLAEPADVAAETGKLIALGLRREGRLVIEFIAAPDARGYYRKYVAMGLDGHVVPCALHTSTDWRMDNSDSTLDDMLEAEQQAYLASDLDDATFRETFRLAGIDIGVVEYFVAGGRPQILAIRPGLPPWCDELQDAEGRSGAAKSCDRGVAALGTLSAAPAVDKP